MKRRQVILLLLGSAVFPATWLYPPWEEEERISRVSQATGQLRDRSDQSDPVQETRTCPVGYAWRFTGPQKKVSKLESEFTYRVDDGRLALLLALATVGLYAAAVVLCPQLVFRTTAPAATTTWRGYVAARIPALIAAALVLAWVLPIQTFLLVTLDTGTWFPVLGLTALALVLGNCIPLSWLRLRRGEADGRIYALLGVRCFRNCVSNGDLAVRLMRWIDPNALARLSRSTLVKREENTRIDERFHWAYLLGSVPTMVWAVTVGESWFAGYLTVANILFNVYPILLQRYTRAQLARIREHPRCRVKEGTAEPTPAAAPAAVADTGQGCW